MSYHLEYITKPSPFDEVVLQDGVKVVVDSKALFSVIGSTMDWREDALGAKFVFQSESAVFSSWVNRTLEEGDGLGNAYGEAEADTRIG